MFLKLCQHSEGVFRKDYRRQLFASLSVTLMSFSHGIGLGWYAPMITKLQSDETPLVFSIDVEQVSWIGAFISLGGLIGTTLCSYLVDRIGRKRTFYFITIPHMCFWTLLYFADSVEYLYLARVSAGTTGGGIFLVSPIFIGEISDPVIRGRLTSLFMLLLNTGMVIGFIMSTYLPYHYIPVCVIVLPMLFLVLISRFPETPQQLLHHGQVDEARESLKFYRSFDASVKGETERFNAFFEDFRTSVTQQKSDSNDISIRDFLSKRSLMALLTGNMLMLVNIFSGTFALMNYMSSIFTKLRTELHPNTNTIIIGVVQIAGTYVSTILVDRFGRKVLLLVSTGGMGIGLACFGMYAFFAEETDMDLSAYSAWLPLVLMAFIIFLANIGIVPVAFVVLVEIIPAKIRAKASSFCLVMLCIFGFSLLKVYPIFMHYFGISATMWFCASVCAFGLFYLTVFLKETKGKSLDKD